MKRAVKTWIFMPIMFTKHASGAMRESEHSGWDRGSRRRARASLQNNFQPFARGINFQFAAAQTLCQRARSFDHLRDLLVVVRGIVVKQKEMFHAGFDSQGDRIVHATVAPAG